MIIYLSTYIFPKKCYLIIINYYAQAYFNFSDRRLLQEVYFLSTSYLPKPTLQLLASAPTFSDRMTFARGLLEKCYRETGKIAAKPFAGGVKLKLTTEQLVILAELIEANNDATLEEVGQAVFIYAHLLIIYSTDFLSLYSILSWHHFFPPFLQNFF